MPNEGLSYNFGRAVAQFNFLPHFNSLITGPIFTKLLHDVEALV